MKKKKQPFDAKQFFATVADGRSIKRYTKGEVIFAQGDACDSIFFVIKGRVKISVTSPSGKEAIVGTPGEHDFFGEGCLIGHPTRLASATAMSESSIMRLEKAMMASTLANERKFAAMFTNHLLMRNSRIEEDLIDQLFNSSDKRLARALLLLANFGEDGKTKQTVAAISQETLAEMIGTTRPRVSFFMNRFKKQGFIEYDGGDLTVHNTLLSVVLRD